MSTRKTKTVRVVRSSVSREGNVSQDSTGVLDVSGNSSLNSSRIQEKDQLTGLNSRLAQYIEKVRQLEAENSRLTVQIRDVEVIEKKEKNSLQERFESEKRRLRLHIEDLEKREARNQVERDAAVADLSRLQAKFAKAERDLSKAITERDDALARADEAGTRLRAVQARLAQLEVDNKELLRENARLPQLQKALEDEVLQKTHAQNERNRALEDLEFQKKQHDSALEEVRHKRQVDMTTYQKQVSQDYQSKMQEQLAAMRAQFQDEIAASNASIESTYKSKLVDAQEARDSARNEAASIRSRIKELETNSYLVDSLRRELTNKKDELANLEADKNARIDELNRDIGRLLEEFHNLRDTKIQLDAELNTYRVLLEAEEERLNITGNSAHNTSVHQTSFSAGTSSAKRGVKRRRMDFSGDDSFRYQRNQLQKETTGPVGIDEVDENAQWVRIANTGDEEVHIGKWKIIVVAGDMEVNFKFNPKMKLGAGQTYTVFSKDVGAVPEGTEGIVMKEQNWPTGVNPKARLVDAEEDTVSTVSLDMVESDDPENPSDRCSIM